MVLRARERVVVAGVIVVEVRHDYVFDGVTLNSNSFEPLTDRPDQGPLAFLPHPFVKSRIDDIGSFFADNCPDVVVERLQYVMRIAANIIFSRLAIVVSVMNGIDFVNVFVAHDADRWPDFTSTPAHCSTGLTISVISESAPSSAFAMPTSWRTALPTIIGTPSRSASSRQRRTSL